MNNPKISIIAIYNNEQSINSFIESLKKQTFKDFEVIFVNYTVDNSIALLISSLIENDDRFHQIMLPENNDIEFAKHMGADIASGDYICFLETEETLSDDFVRDIYCRNIRDAKNKISFVNGRIYKRSFIENNNDIDEIIREKVEIEVQKLYEKLNRHEMLISKELNNCYQNSENTINNKIYDVIVRFNSLEKLFFEKENTIKNDTADIIQNALNSIQENNNHIYDDISKVYEYINAQINQKGCEINKIYEEITNNYKYTEKLKEDNSQSIKNEVLTLNQKIETIVKEQEIRYINLQRLLENTTDDIKYKIEAISIINDSDKSCNIERLKEVLNIESNMNKNLDKMYSYINENNAKFYEELSSLYKELNEKIIK